MISGLHETPWKRMSCEVSSSDCVAYRRTGMKCAALRAVPGFRKFTAAAFAGTTKHTKLRRSMKLESNLDNWSAVARSRAYKIIQTPIEVSILVNSAAIDLSRG